MFSKPEKKNVSKPEKEDSVSIMRIKQQYESIQKKILTTNERSKIKLSKTRKEETDQRIKNIMKS